VVAVLLVGYALYSESKKRKRASAHESLDKEKARRLVGFLQNFDDDNFLKTYCLKNNVFVLLSC
jgi:hypothetical protein